MCLRCVLSYGISPSLPLAMLAVGSAAPQLSYAQTTYTVLHTFSSTDGSMPDGTLLRDGFGNLYGTTNMGGAFNAGTVFKLDTSGYETVLYNFTGGADGGYPFAGLIRDASGNLYGVGGTDGHGTVFKLDGGRQRNPVVRLPWWARRSGSCWRPDSRSVVRRPLRHYSERRRQLRHLGKWSRIQPHVTVGRRVGRAFVRSMDLLYSESPHFWQKEARNGAPRSFALHAHRLRTRFPRQQLPQHVLQNPAVGVVEGFLRGVDADYCIELYRLVLPTSAGASA